MNAGEKIFCGALTVCLCVAVTLTLHDIVERRKAESRQDDMHREKLTRGY